MASHPSLFINVAIPLPVYGTYTYSIPPCLIEEIKIGIRVLVPFGKRKISSFILETTTVSPNYETKAIIKILDKTPLFSKEMVVFFHWIANYYMYPIGEVIKHALPKGLEVHDRIGIRLTEKGRAALIQNVLSKKEHQLLAQFNHPNSSKYIFNAKNGKRLSTKAIHSLEKKGWIEKSKIISPQKVNAHMVQKVSISPSAIKNTTVLSKARRKIINYLQSNGQVNLYQLKTLGSNAVTLARKMAQDGQLDIIKERALRDPFGDAIIPDFPPKLTPEQLVALARIKSTLLREYQTYLLSGVTGSGKTEIYLQLTQFTITQGYSALILVPEIALISQMERRFRARFGNQIAVLHSNLSKGERFAQWEQLATGKISICIGVRSAIFAPLKKIGLIVVDEEHDGSYK
ncbi:MAG: DEAD/DEAH box helicase family protein, partial [Desulfobacteraceae bacterium]